MFAWTRHAVASRRPGWGRRPRREAFVAGVEGIERLALLHELLRLEVDYRRQAGEGPSAAEYETRFPKPLTAVRGLLPAAKPPADTVGGHPAPGRLPITGDEGPAPAATGADGLAGMLRNVRQISARKPVPQT